MSAVKKIDESQQFEEVFDNIVRLYDHAESILNVALHQSVSESEREAFLAIVEPLVNQIEDSVNIISEDFAKIAEEGKEPSEAAKRRVASALRKILFTIEEFRTKHIKK